MIRRSSTSGDSTKPASGYAAAHPECTRKPIELAPCNLYGIFEGCHKLNILVPNLGSTSLKYQILEMPSERVLARGKLERVEDYRQAIAQIETAGEPIGAVAFKAVHAGPRYRGTFRHR